MFVVYPSDRLPSFNKKTDIWWRCCPCTHPELPQIASYEVLRGWFRFIVCSGTLNTIPTQVKLHVCDLQTITTFLANVAPDISRLEVKAVSSPSCTVCNSFANLSPLFFLQGESITDEEVLLLLCKAVAALPGLKWFQLSEIDTSLYVACFERIEEIFGTNFDILEIYLVPSGRRYETFGWICNRNQFYKKQKRFKTVKQAKLR